MTPARSPRALHAPGRRALLSALVLGALAALAASARADTTTLICMRDNTLYESSSGNLSNGSGPTMFAGRTIDPTGSRRRALVRFQVAGVIPAGSTIVGVTLQLFCDQSASGGHSPTSVFHVLADWGEAGSNAGLPGDTGAPAQFGDATWLYRFYPSTPWAFAGGDVGTLSAVLPATPVGVVMISSPGMLPDVQGWLNSPTTNFGWALVGDESVGGTLDQFETREGGIGPRLIVTYQPPATPVQASTWGRVKGDYR